MRTEIRNRLKNLILQTIRGAGYELTPRWRLPNLHLSTHLRKLFSHYNVNVVLDVGANRGQYKSFLRNEVGYAGRIESFEPIPSLATELSKLSAADRNWAVHSVALGAANGVVDLNVMVTDLFSSFLDPLDSLDEQTYRSMNIIKDKVPVDVRRLDGMESEIGLADAEGRVFLKMDTQGFDLEVLKGAAGLLDRVVAIQSEVSVIPLYKHMPDMWTSIDSIRRNGFALSGLFPVSVDDALRVIEFDCLMVKDSNSPPRDTARKNGDEPTGGG